MVNIAVLGCGTIAHRVSKGIKLCVDCNLIAFGSQNITKAKTYAEEYQASFYGDYDRVLNDPSVDAVYICTYNPSHYELIETSLKHHKHVICEKPMVSSVKQLDELFALAKKEGLVLMEAIKSVFLPTTDEIKRIISSDELGHINYISASFCRNEHFDDNHWIFDKESGGALKDLGTYCVSEILYLLDKNPKKVSVSQSYYNSVSSLSQILMDYDDLQAYVLVSNNTDSDCSLKIAGSKGQLVMKDFWKADYFVYESKGVIKNNKMPMLSDFYYEIKHFVNLVENHAIESDRMSQKFSQDVLKITSM